MNNSKRKLIIASVVLNFVTVAYLIGMFVYSLVSTIRTPASQFLDGDKTFVIVYNCFIYGIEILGMLTSAILLLISISNKGMNFQKYKKLYIIAIFINIFLDTISIASVLLVISYFKYLDIEVVKEEDVVEISEDDIKSKIEKLRKLKDEGVISEEEFKEQIMKLL